MAALAFGEKRFASICPRAAASRRRDQAIFDEQLDGIFASAHTLVVEPSLLSAAEVLFAHPSKGQEQALFVRCDSRIMAFV